MELNVVQAMAAVLMVLVTTRALWYLLWRPYAVARWFRWQGIRGPPYNLLVGSLPECQKMIVAGRAKDLDTISHDCITTVQPFFQKWASMYGKTFLYWLGPTPALCSTDMELVKKVLTDRTDMFQKDYSNPSLEAVLGNGVVFANGHDWKRRRKFIHPAFNQEKIKSMSAITLECTQQTMERWRNRQQAEIDMMHDSDEIAMSVIARVMLGKCYKEAWEVFIAGKEQLKLATYAFADPPVPGLWYLPTRRNRRAWYLDKLVKHKISQIIEARLASGVYEDDLLGQMLQLQLQTCSSGSTETLSTEEMVGECRTFFAAGYETSASLITWAMFLLASYPRWQEMVREEVVREYPAHRLPIGDALGKLKLLNMLLLETLRLYGPIAFLQRKTASDTILTHVKVPKGTIITIPLVLLHRDKEIWGPDADEFNPMRFQNGLSRAAKHSHALLAFSFGPRVCAGQNFAMVEVQIVIATIIKSFSFTLSPTYVHKPSNFITLMPKYGLPLIVRNLQLTA
ncbi:cytochrome P450 709B2-like [Triticum dicoccoides]|uniref:cytochrome P450 709B2-like n=2 Tax=Triticum dicoccoides TaxID=85692 RepID=UPI0018906D0A|nr:cytochrome P450 709B2-like [Triticum dicoccoides]